MNAEDVPTPLITKQSTNIHQIDTPDCAMNARHVTRGCFHKETEINIGLEIVGRETPLEALVLEVVARLVSVQ